MWTYKFVNNNQNIRVITNKTISSFPEKSVNNSNSSVNIHSNVPKDVHSKHEDMFEECLDR